MSELEHQHTQKRITDGLTWLVGHGQFGAATREDFAKALHPGGLMLLEGLVSRGYVARRRADGEFFATQQGYRRQKAAVAALEASPA